MDQDEKTGNVEMTPEKIALYNMVFAEAIFELLAEKGILTGEEVLEPVKKLKNDTQLKFRWVH